MKRKLLKASAIGLGFSGVAFGIVSLLGFRWISLSALMYMYVVLAAVMVLGYETRILGEGIRSWMDRFVIVLEEEEMKLKKLASGEKYRVKGEVEKL